MIGFSGHLTDGIGTQRVICQKGAVQSRGESHLNST
jgi:hypothetical protein